MFILQHNNKMNKLELIDGLIKIGYSNNRESIKTVMYRALSNHILVENNGYISVANPTYFIIKIVRGNILDNWKALAIPTSVLALIFHEIDSPLSQLLIVLTLIIIIGWFVDDWLHSLRY
jgi:hypothetical protein